MICMVRQRWGQPGEGRASRELCTFYTFVLCTALLILHPMMLLLEPICKKPLQKLIRVSVNNSAEKQEGEKFCSNVQIFFLSCLFLVLLCFLAPPFDFPRTFLLFGVLFPLGLWVPWYSSRGQKAADPSYPSVTWLCHPSLECLKKKDNNSCVLCSHFGCIDWKI